MAVEVELSGVGAFSGARSSVGTYSVLEESTPIEPSDTSGGTGQINFTAVDDPSRFGSMLLLNSQVKLTDGDRGMVVGKINNLSTTDSLLNVTADSRLGALVGERTAGWVDDTLDNVIRYYLSLAGITTDIAVDASIANLPVTAIGWTGDVWTKIKELLVIYGAEISMVRGDVVVRPVRGRRALEINNIAESWSVSNTDLAEFVEVTYYNTDIRINELVYPAFGWDEDVQVYTIDAGETTTINIPVSVYLSDIQQPVAQDYVAREYVASSVYAVAGNDGKPITAKQWEDTGGRLYVAIGEDGKSIDVTLTGASGDTAELAPYRIAVTAGTGSYYSSLRILGTGAAFDPKTITVPTGAGDLADSDVSVTVDNIYVRTLEDAYNVAAAVGGKYASPVRTLTISKADINKPGSSEYSFNYVTFAENDQWLADNNIETFEDFDAHFFAQKFEDYDAYWYQQVEDNFDFQVFGNANGARLQYRRNMYRIRSVTTTESSVNYTAEADTTFADFEELTEGMTFEEFDALFEDRTFVDFSLAPLVNVKPEYDR